MKTNFSINDIIHIQVVSRLADLLFDELQKIDVQGAPLSVRRIHLKAIENAAAIQRVTLDLLRAIPSEGTASPEDNQRI
jgi:electron transfer flavoprotein alpha/beta subunit